METARRSMILTVVLVSALAQSAPADDTARVVKDSAGGASYGKLTLVMVMSLNPVQKELGLEGDALANVAKVISSIMEETNADVRRIQIEEKSAVEKAGIPTDPEILKNLSPEQQAEAREKRLAIHWKMWGECVPALHAKFEPRLKAALTATQFERLEQIRWQHLGSLALTDHDLVQMLDLTRDQQEKISSLNEEYERKQFKIIAAVSGTGAPVPRAKAEEMRAKLQELRIARDTKATEMLTKDQQEVRSVQNGKPFDTTLLLPPR